MKTILYLPKTDIVVTKNIDITKIDDDDTIDSIDKAEEEINQNMDEKSFKNFSQFTFSLEQLLAL